MKITVSPDEIYTEYRDKVFSYTRSKVQNYQDAEDLCEDVFVKVCQKLDQYDDSKSSLSTWIYNITKNTVIDYYRSHKVNLELIDNYGYEDEPEDEELSEETLQFLAKALNELPETLRDIIVLRYYEDLTLKQISEKMGISYGILKLRHKEALFLLKNKLKNLV
jgi:RNA polymerase sigma-70 factor (ECF subfamily)